MSIRSTRRDFLQVIGTGAATLAAGQFAHAASTDANHLAKFATRSPAKHLILLHLGGGPSQIDTFDPKPQAPVEYRNFDAACQSVVPGVLLSSNLPRLAQRLDQVALIRTLHHDGPATHEAGQFLLQQALFGDDSGIQRAVDTGSDGALRSTRDRMPAGHVHQLVIERALTLPSGNVGQRGYDDINIQHFVPRGVHHASANMELTASRDIKRLLKSRRADYGSHALGQHCQQALELVAGGASTVVLHQFDSVYDQSTWDMHANGGRLGGSHTEYRQTLCPQLDQSLSALLDDLRETGLITETLLLVLGEMGRTPRINCYGGRDHHTGTWTGLIAGGPISGGQFVGTTDSMGEVPLDRPVTFAELGATIQRALGQPVATNTPAAISELI